MVAAPISLPESDARLPLLVALMWPAWLGLPLGSEDLFDRGDYLLGDAELVDHARDDQTAAMDVERGGVGVLVEVDGGCRSR